MATDNQTTRSPTPMERRLLKCLLWVWDYYGQSLGIHGSPDNPLMFEHRNMSAGEEATAILEEYGLAEDQGYCARVTPSGIALMEADDCWSGEAELRAEVDAKIEYARIRQELASIHGIPVGEMK